MMLNSKSSAGAAISVSSVVMKSRASSRLKPRPAISTTMMGSLLRQASRSSIKHHGRLNTPFVASKMSASLLWTPSLTKLRKSFSVLELSTVRPPHPLSDQQAGCGYGLLCSGVRTLRQVLQVHRLLHHLPQRAVASTSGIGSQQVGQGVCSMGQRSGEEILHSSEGSEWRVWTLASLLTRACISPRMPPPSCSATGNTRRPRGDANSSLGVDPMCTLPTCCGGASGESVRTNQRKP
eukprot:4512142-Prymnesium_polylepis.3